MASPHHYRFTVQDALTKIPGPDARRFATIFTHGTLTLEVYAPRGTDPQKPHSRDELYVVISGSGIFVNGADRHPFGPGDVLFAPAGVGHRFVDFTDDFAAWVMFYGPEGGEAP